MEEGKKVAREVVGLTEGARRATGVWPTAGSEVGPLSAKQRWGGANTALPIFTGSTSAARILRYYSEHKIGEAGPETCWCWERGPGVADPCSPIPLKGVGRGA